MAARPGPCCILLYTVLLELVTSDEALNTQPRVQGVDDCATVAAVFKLLDSFEGLLERPAIAAQLEVKLTSLLRSFLIDLQEVCSLCPFYTQPGWRLSFCTHGPAPPLSRSGLWSCKETHEWPSVRVQAGMMWLT